jgi:hypothetical protein
MASGWRRAMAGSHSVQPAPPWAFFQRHEKGIFIDPEVAFFTELIKGSLVFLGGHIIEPAGGPLQ